MKKGAANTLEPAHTFFHAPADLPPALARDGSSALALVEEYLLDKPNPKQRAAVLQSFDKRLSLLWGPPGTGKTATLATLVLSWLEHCSSKGDGLRVCIGASNYNAIDNLLESCAGLLAARAAKKSDLNATVMRVRSDSYEPCQIAGVEDVSKAQAKSSGLSKRLEDTKDLVIIGGTFLQLLRLSEDAEKNIGAAWFDLLVIDEASQLQAGAAMGYMCLLRPTANVVVCGDHKQLGPVYQYSVEDSRSGLLDCIFSYFRDAQQVEMVSLDTNYRSNEAISGWPSARFYLKQYESHHKLRMLNLPNAPLTKPSDWPEHLEWSPVLRQLLDPQKPLTIVTYEDRGCTVSNHFEAQVTAALSYEYATILRHAGSGGLPSDFWHEKAGLVTPHRAQISTIRNLLGADLHAHADGFSVIDTVDRFQGQERDLIIASYTVSDPDFIASEEEFILDPRRFNVTLTRARMKFLMLVSRTLLTHLPADAQISENASHLQLFPESYCSTVGTVDIPYRDLNGATQLKTCKLYVRNLA